VQTDIFHLSIIPIKDILPHEEFDESRAKPLVDKLKKEKQLTNPIIIASLNNGKYLQLDGMNRFSAFKMLGFKSILAQIIDYNDQDTVELSSWVHLFSSSKEKCLKYLESIGGISVKPGKMENVGHRYIKEEGFGRLCTLCCSNGEVFLISTNGNLLDKIGKLNQIVSFYKDRIVRDVLPADTNKGDIEFLLKEHSHSCLIPGESMMIVFPTFTRHQIIETVKRGKLFPAGITRHIIRRRCLNIDAPLTLFDNHQSIEKQNKELEKMLSCRLFRLYEEPTIYFE
jgi:hypothetical protein